MKFNFNMRSLFEKLNIGKGKKDAESTSDPPEQSGGAAEDNGGDGRQKIFGKVGDFFNYEPQKERVLRNEDFKRAGDLYYASVSAAYKVLERLLILVLVIFMSVSLATNYKNITYNNVFYLFRDFTTAADSRASNYQVLSYDSDSRQKFALYRGGLVSVSPSSVSVFTAGGRRTLKNSTEYYSPSLICCDKYVLVYDGAGSSFSVYNSFSKVYEEKFEYPITDACFDSGGAFALATRKNDSKTLIYLYGDNIKRRGEIPDNRFVFDMALDSADGRFAALYYDVGSGIGRTSVCVYDVKSSSSAKMLKEIELNGEFPLDCSFTDSGGLSVITNRSVRIYDKKYREDESRSFGDASVTAFSADVNGAAVSINSGTRKKVIAFDKSGKLIYDGDISENVRDIEVSGRYVFLQNVSGVIRLDTKDGKEQLLPSDGSTMLIYSDDTAISCSEARAEYLVFKK